jgi:hypothetical protein
MMNSKTTGNISIAAMKPQTTFLDFGPRFGTAATIKPATEKDAPAAIAKPFASFLVRLNFIKSGERESALMLEDSVILSMNAEQTFGLGFKLILD